MDNNSSANNSVDTSYIDLQDIQGNIVKGYGRYGYPFARYVFFQFTNPTTARDFVRSLLPLLTNGTPWGEQTQLPDATTNIAFTYQGLKRLGLPKESLHSFPQDFSMGMKARDTILGDDLRSAPEHWDPIWHKDKDVHMFLSINAKTPEMLTARYEEIRALHKPCISGVVQLGGHRAANGELKTFQDAHAVFENGTPTPKEHFGYTDGISDPYFKGSGANPANVIGGGKPTRMHPATDEGWQPLETGEFILGYRDETRELPEAPQPRMLSMNGTFMVYRKLHQNVGSFNSYLNDVGKDYPGGRTLLSAKMTGRWTNGAPLASFATQEEADGFGEELLQARMKLKTAQTESEKKHAQDNYTRLRRKLSGFNYNDDLDGKRCPLGAHMRRANPRGSLEYGVKDAFDTPGALVDRRRILRRGLPYGEVTDNSRDDGEHGIIFMALNASISRQFEFVQQQWMNYSNDFKLSNEKDPLVGNQDGSGAMMIPGTSGDNPPFFCPRLPRFVETRGGEYFFIPSITAVRMITDGLIDPT